MAKLGFSYLPRIVINPKTSTQEETFTPFIPIKFSTTHNNPTNLIDALIDSGSDTNLFPMQLGEMLSIKFKKMNEKIIYGIGGAQIKAYTAKINIWLNNTKYETEADFSREHQGLLLGRQGFFNLFKSVTFDEKGRFTYIETFS